MCLFNLEIRADSNEDLTRSAATISSTEIGLMCEIIGAVLISRGRFRSQTDETDALRFG
jgi:hypothetical protein